MVAIKLVIAVAWLNPWLWFSPWNLFWIHLEPFEMLCCPSWITSTCQLILGGLVWLHCLFFWIIFIKYINYYHRCIFIMISFVGLEMFWFTWILAVVELLARLDTETLRFYPGQFYCIIMAWVVNEAWSRVFWDLKSRLISLGEVWLVPKALESMSTGFLEWSLRWS